MVSYKKLWKILIEKDMTRAELCKLANVSTYTMTKLGKGQTVTTEVLVKICRALECSFDDIMEIVDIGDN